MAKRRKHIEVRRWRVGCLKCGKTCMAAVERFARKKARKVVINFECHACGLSGEVELRGEDAREFFRQ